MSQIETKKINSLASSIAGVNQGRGICYGTASVVTALHLLGYSTDKIRQQFEMVNQLMEYNTAESKTDIIKKYHDLGLLDQLLKDRHIDKDVLYTLDNQIVLDLLRLTYPSIEQEDIHLRLQAEKDNIQRSIRKLMVDKITSNDSMFTNPKEEDPTYKLLKSMADDTFDINEFDEKPVTKESVEYEVQRLLVQARMTYQQDIKSLLNKQAGLIQIQTFIEQMVFYWRGKDEKTREYYPDEISINQDYIASSALLDRVTIPKGSTSLDDHLNHIKQLFRDTKQSFDVDLVFKDGSKTELRFKINSQTRKYDVAGLTNIKGSDVVEIIHDNPDHPPLHEIRKQTRIDDQASFTQLLSKLKEGHHDPSFTINIPRHEMALYRSKGQWVLADNNVMITTENAANTQDNKEIWDYISGWFDDNTNICYCIKEISLDKDQDSCLTRVADSYNIATSENKEKKYRGEEPLYLAVVNRDVTAVRQLIDANVDVNKANTHGVTPLFNACHRGHTDVVKILLDKGATVDRARQDGLTPLFVACQQGHIDVVKILLDKGATVDKAKNTGTTPLFIACQQGHTDVVKILLDKGATVDRARQDGVTPLYMACQEGHLDVVDILGDHGADVDQATKDGVTPLYIACQYGHIGVVEALLNAGAIYKDSEYLLKLAPSRKDLAKVLLFTECKKGNDTIVNDTIVDEFLDKKDVNQSDSKGKTALWYALKNKHRKVVKKLTDRGATLLRNDLSDFSIHKLEKAGFTKAELKKAGFRQTYWHRIVGFFMWLAQPFVRFFNLAPKEKEQQSVTNDNQTCLKATQIAPLPEIVPDGQRSSTKTNSMESEQANTKQDAEIKKTRLI